MNASSFLPRRSSSARRARALFALASALALASCTLLGSREIVQCQTSSDCTLLTSRHVCSSGLCVVGPTVDARAEVDASEETAPECSKHADCAQAPENPTLCSVEGRCTPVVTKDHCPVVLPPGKTAEGRFVFGVYLPDPFNGGMRAAVEQAIVLFENAYPEQKLLAVLCAKGDGDPKSDVVDHFKNLRVPLVLGQFESKQLQDLLEPARAGGVTLWSTLGNTPPLQQLKDGTGQDLVYRFLLDEIRNLKVPLALDAAGARYRASYLGSDGGTSPPGGYRVALLVDDAPESALLATALTSNPLTVSGEMATIKQFAVPATGSSAVYETEALKVRDGFGANMPPHIVVSIGGDRLLSTTGQTPDAMLPAIEKLWTTPERPIHVLLSRTKQNVVLLRNFMKSSASLRRRIIGVDFGGDRLNYDRFRTDGEGNTDEIYADHLYDATLAVGFAAVAAYGKRAEPMPAVPLSSSELREGLGLLDGTATEEVRLDESGGVARGAALLRTGRKIRYVGTTGAWSFDDAGVTRRMGTSFYCFRNGTDVVNVYVDGANVDDPAQCAVP